MKLFRMSKRQLKLLFWFIIKNVSFTRCFYETKYTQTPITFKYWFIQKVLGFNRNAYWPIHFTSIVVGPKNIYAGIDTAPGYSGNCYIQGGGKVYIGDYTQIGPGVGIISANHKTTDSREHIRNTVRIGKYCWLGMNSIVLPGVILGDFTIIAAGTVVTKSFENGYCIIAGNPAKEIKKIPKEECILFENKYKYNGYIKFDRFEMYRKTKLNV